MTAQGEPLQEFLDKRGYVVIRAMQLRKPGHILTLSDLPGALLVVTQETDVSDWDEQGAGVGFSYPSGCFFYRAVAE